MTLDNRPGEKILLSEWVKVLKQTYPESTTGSSKYCAVSLFRKVYTNYDLSLDKEYTYKQLYSYCNDYVIHNRVKTLNANMLIGFAMWIGNMPVRRK